MEAEAALTEDEEIAHRGSMLQSPASGGSNFRSGYYTRLISGENAPRAYIPVVYMRPPSYQMPDIQRDQASTALMRPRSSSKVGVLEERTCVCVCVFCVCACVVGGHLRKEESEILAVIPFCACVFPYQDGVYPLLLVWSLQREGTALRVVGTPATRILCEHANHMRS